MSELQQLLRNVAIACDVDAASKKKALQALAKLLAPATGGLDENAIFDSLVSRERLGSTGIGEGIAIPHGRLDDLPRPAGALLVLRNGIDYDALDQQPVLILFGLLVPQSCNDVHLQILAGLAQMFSHESLRAALRGCQGEDAIRATMLEWGEARAASA